MKKFLTLSLFASALAFAACGTTADQTVPASDDAMMKSSAGMMESSEDSAMMEVDVDAKMQASAAAQ